MVIQSSNDDNMRRVIGSNIRSLRVASGKSVIDLTAAIGMARGYWYEIERGEKNVTIDTLRDIAEIFGVTVRELFTEPKPRIPAGARK
jgi:transcriptional regulator with XRE-family HTH domain